MPNNHELLGPDMAELLANEGVKLSRSAKAAIKNASSAGIPIDELVREVSQAAVRAKMSGRGKIGVFGPNRNHFSNLQERTDRLRAQPKR